MSAKFNATTGLSVEGKERIYHLCKAFRIIAKVDQYLLGCLHEHLKIFFDIVGVVRTH